tara:strand:+ start:145 stop:387 length:243 start_codon:yes stop_codon:yes gene_type:complete
MNGAIFKESRRSEMFDFFDKFMPVTKTSVKHTVIKWLTSKGPGGQPVALTVDDINRGYILDNNGYKNEIVLFLRKDKKDR